MSDPEGYSSADEKAKARKLRREQNRATRRREARQFEPRHYSLKQEDWARRFNRGISITGGDI